MDFYSLGGEITLADGEMHSAISISIVDDVIREPAEYFEVYLVSTEGGALLGSRRTAQITISKSDYPNGRFMFAGQLRRTVANPSQDFAIDLSVKRQDGLIGTQIVSWGILGPNSLTPLEATSDLSYTNRADLEMTQGQFLWDDGEGGERRLTLTVKAHSGWEVQKTFIVHLYDVQNDMDPQDNGEIDVNASNVTLTIQKNGDPNGIVRFSVGSMAGQTFEEPVTGSREVSFFVERLEGNIGDQEILWEIEGPTEDLVPMSGSTYMTDGSNIATIRLNILADSLPELTEMFTLHLRNVIGGATLQPNLTSAVFSILYNDDPHGVFGLQQNLQTITVHPVTLLRTVNVIVTRAAGVVGSVRATVGVAYSRSGSNFPTSQSVVFAGGQAEASLSFDILGDLFVDLDSYFVLAISEVVYLGGETVTSPPRIGENGSMTITVPESAANSYVSFSQPIYSIDAESQEAEVGITRRGLYGNLEVAWAQGYGDSTIPPQFIPGIISPSHGRIYMGHGARSAMFAVSVTLTDYSLPPLFAIHLPSQPVTTALGGSRLEENNPVAELEPSGLVRFKSTTLSVHENQGTVSAIIQRVFGSLNSIQITYSTVSGTAEADNDFIPIQSETVVLTVGQSEVAISVPVVIDPVSEKDEMFSIRLERVLILPTTLPTTISPRLDTTASQCNVTILANGDPYGLLDIIANPTRVVEANENTVSQYELTL